MSIDMKNFKDIDIPPDCFPKSFTSVSTLRVPSTVLVTALDNLSSEYMPNLYVKTLSLFRNE